MLCRSRLIFASLVVVGACGGNPDRPPPGAGAAAGDAGASDAVSSSDGTTPQPTDGSHPLCPGNDLRSFSPFLKTDLGYLCTDYASGSADPCVYPTNHGCSSNLCALSDGNGFCTIECDAADASSCPLGFICTSSVCGSARPVCMVAPEPKPRCETPGPSAALDDVSFGLVAVTASLRTYALGTSGAAHLSPILVSRRANESSWTKVSVPLEYLTIGAYTAASAGETALFSTGGGRILVVDDLTSVAELLPGCETSGPECVPELSAFFRVGDEVRGIGTRDGGGADTFARKAGGGWTKLDGETQLTGEAGQKPVITALVRSGLVATCGTSSAARLCTSLDGVTWNDVALPTGEAVISTVAAGESVDDFFLMTADETVWHRARGTWIREGAPPGFSADNPNTSMGGAFLLRRADGALYAGLRYEGGRELDLALDAAGCWRFLPFGRIGIYGVPYDQATFVSASLGPQVCFLPAP